MIGFSTGALAYSDFRTALQILVEESISAVEISALRFSEWKPLLDELSSLQLATFDYISIHLPSAMGPREENEVARSVDVFCQMRWPLILHPDAISDFGLWRELGDLICIENMDNRKPVGRTEGELEGFFDRLPEAKFCFDIGHAWQVDPTMTEAYSMLKTYRDRLAQLHVSEVNSHSKHDSLSYSTIQSFRDVAHLIPNGTPLILETPVKRGEIHREINKTKFALLPAVQSFRVA
jgi:hypothetical protein